MKTNKAPEKIYVKITHPISDEYTEIIAFEDGDGVGYTRTDFFIEKACSWLKENADSYTWYDEMEGESGMIDEFIDDFKKYMEGE